MNKLERLKHQLENAANSFPKTIEVFESHSKSSFLNDYFLWELSAMAEDPDYAVGGVSGQLNIKLINTGLLDYTVHLKLPSEYKPNLKWMSVSQIMVIKGSGCVDVRKLRIPNNTDINEFQSGVELEILEHRTLHNGDIYFSAGPNEITEILKVRNHVIIDTLTVKNPLANVFWNFDQNLRSAYSESASLTTSRLLTIFNVVSKMKISAPSKLYNFAFAQNDANLKLKAVATMFKEGDTAAFDILNDYIECDDPVLSTGALNMLYQFT